MVSPSHCCVRAHRLGDILTEKLSDRVTDYDITHIQHGHRLVLLGLLRVRPDVRLEGSLKEDPASIFGFFYGILTEHDLVLRLSDDDRILLIIFFCQLLILNHSLCRRSLRDGGRASEIMR
jgi:hypothetical protein